MSIILLQFLCPVEKKNKKLEIPPLGRRFKDQTLTAIFEVTIQIKTALDRLNDVKTDT